MDDMIYILPVHFCFVFFCLFYLGNIKKDIEYTE